jgi:GT2 family glycosyltransferase
MSRESSVPLVCVITINYNHASDTINCVKSIIDSSYSNFKVFVVDNGSREEDYRNLASGLETYSQLEILRIEKNVGYVGGVNHGLKLASELRPKYFIVMNNDTIIDKEAISELVKTGEKYNGEAIVSGKVYNMDEPDTLQYIGQWTKNETMIEYSPYVLNSREKDIGQFEDEMELGMTDDIFWLLPYKIFKKVGYYSTDFFLYGEQNDYVLRTKKAGFKIIYTPNSKIWHFEHLTTKSDHSNELQLNKHIEYWMNYAYLILIFRNSRFPIFLFIYLRLFFKMIYQYIKSYFSGNSLKINKIKIWFTSNYYFLIWLFGKRGINRGFNPYLKA